MIGKPPPCWDTPEAWAEWNQYNDMLLRVSGQKPDHFCADCTPEYQARMVTEGRCQHPNTQFVHIVERVRMPGMRRRAIRVSHCIKGIHPKED